MDGNEVEVAGEVGNLEDGVPVGLVVEPLFAGDKGVGDGEDLLRRLEPRVRFACPDREGLTPDEVAAGEELLGDRQPPLRLRSARRRRRRRRGHVEGIHLSLSRSLWDRIFSLNMIWEGETERERERERERESVEVVISVAQFVFFSRTKKDLLF